MSISEKNIVKLVSIALATSIAFAVGYALGHGKGYEARKVDEAVEEIRSFKGEVSKLRQEIEAMDDQESGMELMWPYKDMVIILAQGAVAGINECHNSQAADCTELFKSAEGLLSALKPKCESGVKSACEISQHIESALKNDEGSSNG